MKALWIIQFSQELLTSPTINAITALQLNGVNINTIYAPMAPMLDSYALESEASSLHATNSSVNNKAPLNNPEFTGTITAPNINASTALQIVGVSTNTLYNPRVWFRR